MKNQFSFKIDRFTGGPVETHAYLVTLPEGNLLVDAPEGAADYFRDVPIDLLILTHSHFDHVMDAAKIVREKKCGAAMHRTTEEHLADKMLNKRFGLPIEIEPVKATTYLEESKQQNILGALFDIFEVPGHCPGSICLYNGPATNLSSRSTDVANCGVAPVLASSSINDTLSRCATKAPGTSSTSATLKPGSKILFGGDVLFAGGVGRWDLPGGDGKLLIDGIRKKLLTLPPETRVLPGHGPETTIGMEAKTNGYLRGCLEKG